MAYSDEELLGLPAEKTPFSDDELLGMPSSAQAKPPAEVEGGLAASAKQTLGQTVKGIGQAAADYIPGVSQDNAVTRYGQEVVEANPTVVKGFRDIVRNPGKTVTEALGNALPSVGLGVGLRAAGMGLTALSPAAGPLAPVVAAAGQGLAWGGPILAAALPSYSGIREAQIEKGGENVDDPRSKLLATLGAATVGAIEQRFGPQNWAQLAISKEGRAKLAGMMAGDSFWGKIGKGALKGAAVEGSEELAQNPIEQLAAYEDPTTAKSLEETAFGGVMGAVGGGVLGGGFGITGTNKKTDPAVEKVQTDALNTVLPEGATLDKLEGGEATVTIQTASGTTTVTAAPEDIAKQMLAGKPLSEMAKQGVESRATRLADLEAKALGGEQFTPDERKEYQKLLAKSGTKKFEQLQDDPARPEVVRFRVADKVYEYAPPAGMSRAQIDAELATRAKSPGSQFNWLKKNTVEVKDVEVKPQATPANEPVQAVQPGPEQVVDGVSESLIPQGEQDGTRIPAGVTPEPARPEIAETQEAPDSQAGSPDAQVDTLNNLTFQHDSLVDQWEALPAGPEKTAVQDEIFKIREEMNNAAVSQTAVPPEGGVGQGVAVAPEVLPTQPPAAVKPAGTLSQVLEAETPGGTQKSAGNLPASDTVSTGSSASVGGKPSPDVGRELQPVRVAAKVDKDLKYDGDNLGLPQFTYQAGPLKGVTFSAKDASEESVRTAAEKMKAQWEGKKNNAVQENNTPSASVPDTRTEGVTPAKVKKSPKAKPEKKAVEPVYRDGSGSETLQIQPYGKIVALNDTKGNLLGRFDTAEKAAIAARDMGYGWRDQTGQLPTKPSEKPAPKAKPEKKAVKSEKPKGDGKLKPLPSAYAVQAKVIAEDIAAGDTAFKRVPSDAAIRAYREKNPRAKADAAMAEMAEMDEAEYQGLTAVIEDEMVAWHGTPHTVDKFSSSKIGTGEGAQAYGYGLYFAGAKEIAQWYQKQLSPGGLAGLPSYSIGGTTINPRDKHYRAVSRAYSSLNIGDALSKLQIDFTYESNAEKKQEFADAIEFLKTFPKNSQIKTASSKGKLYQVELAPAEDEYLLWDLPLSEQSDKVKKAINNAAEEATSRKEAIEKSLSDIKQRKAAELEKTRTGEYKDLPMKEKFEILQKLNGEVSAEKLKLDRQLDAIERLNSGGVGRLTNYLTGEPVTGEQLYKQLGKKFGDATASMMLHSLGIRGIKYLDGTSRSKGEGAYNYVVFNDEDITILSAEKQDRNQLGDPSKAEAEKVQKGIEGKTLIQAAEWLINNTPNNGHKLIAAKVRVALLRLKGAGVEFNLNITHVGDKIPASSAMSRGVSTTDFSQGIKTTVRLNGADVTGKVGMSYETVLHEIIHAATQAAIHVGNRRVSAGTTLAKTTADLIAATNLIINHFNTRAASGETLTEFEHRILQRNVNALNNPSEVLAWTLSNKEMQDYLETVKLNKTETLWSRFVQSVRTFFGLTAASDTALSEVLRLGEDLLNADANVVTSSLDKLMGRTPVNEFAQDAQTDIRKATRVIQNMPAFKKWFGDSKVVDSAGKPLVVYHGGASTVSVFATNGIGPFAASRKGAWFTPNPAYASIAANKKDGAVYPVYLDIKNPKYAGMVEASMITQEQKDALIAQGYDGIVDIRGNLTQYVVFEPTQIKSIFNQTWDPANPAIDMQVQTPLGVIADEQISEALKSGQKKLDTAVQALKNPKSKLHDLYVQYAPQWLAVTPLHTLVQTFGKAIPQIKDFAKHLDAVVSAKTEIVDTSKVVYDKAMEMAQKTVGLDVFNNAAATASFNRMTPWKDLYSQDWTKGKTKSEKLKNAQKKWVAARMQKATGLTYIEAYSETKKAYDALKTDDMKQAYQDTVEHIAGIRTREKNNLLRYIEKVTEPGSDERKEMMLKFDATFTDLHGAYWPLARVGDFVLKYVDKDGFKWAEHFTTIAERNEAKAERIAAGVDPSTIKESYKDKQPAGAVAIPAMMLEQLSKTVRAKYMKDVNPNDSEAVEAAMEAAQNTINDMTQIWLRWQPETSALKNSVRRKNVKGYSLDMLRSYLDYMQRHASNIAWTEQGKKIEGDLKSMGDNIKAKLDGDAAANTDMENHLLNDLRARVQALRSVKVGVAASFLGKIGTGWYMTSPSIALVQMTQLGALTLPKLAVKYGPVKAAKALALWTKEAFKKEYRRAPMFNDPIVELLFDELHAVVTIDNRNTPAAKKADGTPKDLGDRLYSDEQMIERISSKDVTPYQRRLLVLREAMARNLLDISAAHEAYDLTRGKDPDSMMSKVFNLAMKPMSLSELTSRKAAVLSTYDLASQDGKDFFLAMNDIAEVVNDTLYSYSKENKGAALQGGLTRVVLQFQHYRIMTGIRLAMLFHQGLQEFRNEGVSAGLKADATKEFVGIMGMTGALAGSLGMPFAGTVFAILGAILGDDDEPEDYRLMYTNWLQDTFPKTIADLLTHGLPSLAGADISKRVGLQDVYGMQSEPPPRLHGKELAAWWAANQLGPVFSVGAGLAQGYDEMINKGNYMKGLEAAAPKPIKDVFKAIRVATDGVKTGAGKKLIPDDQIGPDEVLMIALGFNPEEISKAQGAERSLRGISTQITERRGKLIRRAAEAILEGDGDSAAMEDIRKFNLRMPRFAISGRDIKPVVRKILWGESGTTGKRERDVATQYEVPVLME